VVDLMLAEFARMGEPTPATELTARKAVLIGNFGRQTETNDGLADALSELALYGLPLSTLGEYVAHVEAVTAEQVQAAGRKWFAPEAATVVVAGDAKEFLAPLKSKHPEVEVLSAEKMNLDSATLK
jgi:zinc protease